MLELNNIKISEIELNFRTSNKGKYTIKRNIKYRKELENFPKYSEYIDFINRH